MTSIGKDALWSFLFASDGYKLVNLKLMRGDSQDVSVSQLREEVHSALLQAKTNVSAEANFPDEGEMLNVDVRKLAAAI